MIDDAEEPERLGRFVAQLVGLERAYAGDVHRRQCLPAGSQDEHPAAAGTDHDVRVQVLLEAGVSARLDLEVAQVRARALPELADQLDSAHSLEGQVLREVARVLVGGTRSSAPFEPGTMREHARRLRIERLLAKRPRRLHALLGSGADDVQIRAGAGFEVFPVADERAADQQHRVGTVVGAHAGKLLEGHSAGRARPGGRQPAERSAEAGRDARAVVAGELEPAADVGEDRDVRAGDAKQRPEQQAVLDALAPRNEVATGEGGVRHQHQIVVARERSGNAESGDERRGEHAGEPQPRHVLEPAGERGQGTGDVGEVQAAASGALVRVVHRVGAPLHPVLEGLEFVDEVLVVLDDVAAAAGEGARHLHEPAHGNASRLERGGEQRAAVHAGERPHAGHAVSRARESGEDVLREREIHEPNAGHHRDVAEHEVDECRYAARLDHRRVVAQHGPCGARRAGSDVDPLDLSDHTRRQAGSVHQRLRYLHRLLERDGGREGVRRTFGVVQIVGRDDSIAGELGRFSHRSTRRSFGNHLEFDVQEA